MFITMLYFAVLARDPDAGGFNFWLGIANTPISAGAQTAGIYFQTNNAARVLIEGPGTPNVGLVGGIEFQTLFNN